MDFKRIVGVLTFDLAQKAKLLAHDRETERLKIAYERSRGRAV